jgi:hypothetical protein
MRQLRLEDGVLAAWNALGVPLVALSALRPVVELGNEPHLLAGVIQLLAVLGAIVAIATRPTGSQPGALPVPTMGMLTVVVGPLIGGIAFVAGSASSYLGVALDGPAIGIAFLAATAVMAFGNRLPVLDAGIRRLLVVPFILVTAGIFNGFAADLLSGLDLQLLSSAGLSEEGGLFLFFAFMLLGGLAFFYASLVAAPRILADPEHSGFWALRFVVYVVSAVLGIGWLTALAG